MAFLMADASRYQGNVDWEKAKADGIQWAMLKTVSTNNREFGGLYIDPFFERNYAECKRLGIPVGVYYYTYAQDKASADKELALFKQAVAGKTFELPLVVDVEDNLLKPLSADALTDLVIYALETIESWGCYAMLYTYLYYQNTELNMSKLADYDLWLAAYRDNRPTAPKHNIWQFTSEGQIDGFNGNVDLNYAYKNYPEIIRGAGLNGFVANVTSALSNEPCKLIIGPMSTGDRVTIGKLLHSLGITYTVTAEGYVITDAEVERENKIKIETKCRQITNIVVKDLMDIEIPAECICSVCTKLAEYEWKNTELQAENNYLKETLQNIKDIICETEM